jgi:uncharacterized protein
MTMTLAEDVRPAAPERGPTHFPGAEQFDMTSKISGRSYRVFVFQPPVLAPPPGGFPVVTLSDGNMNFPIAAVMSAMFAFSASPALVVGVGYPTVNPMELTSWRTRDLTPPTPIENVRPQPGMPAPRPEDFGGAEDFHRFLTEELRPVIAAGWKVDADSQTLYGFSLGGLFTLTTLFAHPDAYKTFVAASPSIWWNERAVLADEAEFARRVEAGEVAPRVLVTIGGLEQQLPKVPPPGYTPEAVEELMLGARMVDNARELGARLAALKGGPGYLARFHEFPGEDHLTAMAGSVARCLDFALRP